ncbi:MAG: hypothetical protein JXQ75_20305 [Phycisphaerae bacterium]|nr:hypothetical protein [Phycisphaerae bacterium]
MAVSVPLYGATCSGLGYLFGPQAWTDGSNTDLELAIAVVQPIEQVAATPGATTPIQWADIAKTPGTVVRVAAQRVNDQGEDVGDPIHIIGDGTAGSGRDAIADGDNDVVDWDITGVRVGSYVMTVTLEAPDGTTATAVSRDEDKGTNGVISVQSPLPAPTLTFTAPGNDDVTVNVGGTFDITWSDNGTANAQAVFTLGLDTDDDHESGNEVILLSDQPLSDDGDDGSFTFTVVDENGDAVPEGTYVVFAILDDSAHQIVTQEATGRLTVAP